MTTTYVDLRFTDTTGRQHTLFAVARHGRRRLMRVVGAVAAGVGLLLLLGAGAPAYAGRQAAPPPAVEAFVEATREYAALHRRLEANLPKLEVSSNPDTIFRLVEQMAAALRNARPDARPGEFFTEAVAVELRTRIAGGLAANGFTAADVREAAVLDGVDATRVSLRVNGTFPWLYATAMFPCVLNTLPALPPELQYRIVGNTLVLIDVHASLVVDLLPYPLADTER